MNKVSLTLPAALESSLKAHTGRNDAIQFEGGLVNHQINSSLTVVFGGTRYFVKLNKADRRHMFEAERDGLQEIASCKTIRVPEPICVGNDGNTAYLVLEYLDLKPRGNAGQLGVALAAMHRCRNLQFGWNRSNTIGFTEQVNTPSKDWVKFWSDYRLSYQLNLAASNGYTGQLLDRGVQLASKLGGFFSTYKPVPSLLHGDLWSGNHAYLSSGEPVIFDPAVYYGDRETDLAMTELFGGFAPEFFTAYQADYPLDEGYQTRKQLYNLYHVLNHLNLFGTAYLGQATTMIDRLLGELN